MNQFKIDPEISPNTKVYRYISFESFLSLLETKCLLLSNINTWDDTWEMITGKIPVINENNEVLNRLYSHTEDLFGSCWSLLKESDAMWRIYSPHKTGIQISTSASKFSLIQEVKRSYLGKVVYYQNFKELTTIEQEPKSPFSDALYKRNAFNHEQEIRFLSHKDFIPKCEPKCNYVSLPVDPISFLESITIDPRATDWFVGLVEKYCWRIGMSIKPSKSNLYESDPYLKTGFVKKYVPRLDRQSKDK